MLTVTHLANERSAPRASAETKVWLRCRRITTAASADLAERLLDISAGGLQLVATEPLFTWETVEVVLGSAAIREPIRRLAEVRWVLSLGGEPCCAGLQFLAPLGEEELKVLNGTAAVAPEVAGPGRDR